MKNMLTTALLALAFLPGIGARAATITSTQSGAWSSSTTWGGGPAPSAGDAVVVNGDFTVTVDVPSAACLNLQLGGTTSNSGM